MDNWYILEFYVGRNPHPFHIVGRDTPSEALRYETKWIHCLDHENATAVIRHDEIISIAIFQQGSYSEIMRTWEEMEGE